MLALLERHVAVLHRGELAEHLLRLMEASAHLARNTSLEDQGAESRVGRGVGARADRSGA